MEMIFIIEATFIMFLHWIGDFVFQTRYIAEHKSESILILLVHTILYSMIVTVGMLIMVLLLSHYFYYYVPVLHMGWFFGITFVTHTVTDYITSRQNKKFYNQNRMKAFWVSVGFDQFIHITTLYLTFFLYRMDALENIKRLIPN